MCMNRCTLISWIFSIKHVLCYFKVATFCNDDEKRQRRYFAAPLNFALRLSVAIISSSVIIAYERIKQEILRENAHANTLWEEERKRAIDWRRERRILDVITRAFASSTQISHSLSAVSSGLLAASGLPSWNMKHPLADFFLHPTNKWLLLLELLYGIESRSGFRLFQRAYLVIVRDCGL